jgi:hypothetical protein
MKTLALTSFLFSVALQAANSINTPMVIPATGVITTLAAPNSDKELAWVDEQIQAIKPQRTGISDAFINSLGDPIKHTVSTRTPNIPPPFLNPPKMTLLAPPKLGTLTPVMPSIPKVVEEPLRLQALVNLRALINGKWYRVNDLVRLHSLTTVNNDAARSYTILEMKSSSIVLRGPDGKPLILFLTKTNPNITINTK